MLNTTKADAAILLNFMKASILSCLFSLKLLQILFLKDITNDLNIPGDNSQGTGSVEWDMLLCRHWDHQEFLPG